ncbi:hypothetical protein BKA62DRAFT_709272 [Auriculariales sp. MPI-PUGE-AT-0066]|nr:hypothetical protein BKA62DRAFT_709272 [Auriculariales sp. MPI-PUGE-AT-0066]
MLDAVPTELAIHIIRSAALQFIAIDRPTVISLAQTSTVVYKVVAPVLYRVIVVSEKNMNIVRELMFVPDFEHLAQRVGALVRELLLLFTSIDDSGDTRRVLRFMTGVESISAFSGVAVSLLPETSSLRCLKLGYARELDSLPQPVKFNLTHISLYVGNTTDYVQSPVGYCAHVLGALPTITHVGLGLITVEDDDARWQWVNGFNIPVFELLLRAILAFNKVRHVAIRVSGGFVARYTEIENLLRQVKDTRATIWCDHRRLESWPKYAEVLVDDAWNERNVWSEARAMGGA